MRKVMGWAKHCICRDCWKEEHPNDYDEPNERVERKTAHLKLSPLRGSVKQVSWAKKLRIDMIERIHALIDFSMADEALKQAFHAICMADEAKWWIENRSRNTASIIEEMYDKFHNPESVH